MSDQQPLDKIDDSSAGCPVHGGMKPPAEGGGNRDWWPDQLNLKLLAENPAEMNPYGADFDYGAEFDTLDLEAVRADLYELLHDSKSWWPADYGNYGPLFVRMAWHAAGTYRITDGRGGAGHGMQRFAPLNSWPDNAGLDKARRLLWPIKKKYGAKLSWGDLIIMAGTFAMEEMGFTSFGFAGGREDKYEPEEVFWGPETEWLGDNRYTGERDLDNPLAAVQMGLIYVNPEGPNGDPDPLKAAVDIRETFARMAMDDEETVALIAGGHTFGKTHGNGPADVLGPEPEGAGLEEMGLGWKNPTRTGVGADAVSSGLEGAWNSTPTTWDNNFFWTLFGYEWELGKSPAGAQQWHPKDNAGATSVPDPADPERKHQPMMLTTDLALRFDPIYEKISRRFLEKPQEFADAYARAWFKLTHRDMGPVSRYRGSLAPTETLIWQDPVPAVDHRLVDAGQIAALKATLLESGLSVSQLVKTAWAAAASYRGSDHRGGANGGRIRLEPQRSWEVNEPAELDKVIPVLEKIADDFNASATDGTRISFADLVVLGGAAGVEQAARNAGVEIEVPFTPGRTDATQETTDVASFNAMRPRWDGFRNYVADDTSVPAEALLVDRAQLLTLTAPQMAVLIGGLRVLGANYGGSSHGVFTDRPEVLSTDFFTTITDMDIAWTAQPDGTFAGADRATGEQKFTGTRADLVFGSNAQLRALAEVYGADDAHEKFVADFVTAWNTVMDADRFELRR
ncbi:catalase/peroxidase HPI [Gordonia sp. VNK21]|uniref:catalase/peroxidase HPI n=1 Tax=Gordonia sp. VNK21 TaxID=3382483 RepID=UPI0038D3E5B2